MEFDVIGVLVFLWFIFRGLRKSQQAKRNNGEKQQERPLKQRPVVQTQPRRVEKKEAPTNPFPPWFPFPIEIEEEEPTPKKTKAKPKPVMQEVKKEQARPLREHARTVSLDSVTPITQGEDQWKNQEMQLQFDKRAVTNGILWSEILGAPRSKRKSIR